VANVSIASVLRDRALAGSWKIFVELANKTEPERRPILRSHREAPFTDPVQVADRERLDDALERVMLLELGVEIGVLPDDKELKAVDGLPKLLASSAFIRYLDSYLALSVRFVATRLDVPYETPNALNDLPAARPCPPPIPANAAGDAEPTMMRFIQLETALKADANVALALRFLDGFAAPGEPAQYELWLRRLGGVGDETRFKQITRGLVTWSLAKAAFYEALEAGWRRAAQRGSVRGSWTAKHPLTARFGVNDLYWLARMLRAEVTPAGTVTYADGSWLEMLRARAADVNIDAESLSTCEDVLHGVFDYACDLVGNAADIADEDLEKRDKRARRKPWPATTVGWRAMYDEELAEIERQRKERFYVAEDRPPMAPAPAAAAPPGPAKGAPSVPAKAPAKAPPPVAAKAPPPRRVTWSRRICTGEHVNDLVGLALSGGGIRSATFSLGVLQRLQELDLLRQVDYLSTVSGGGYIGAWLLASVKRTRYWLTQPTDWTPSIAHLRRYSNYLSPRTGLMSADTWTMWGSWIRNAALIQVSAVAWLALVMLVVGIGRLVFSWAEARWVYGPIVTIALIALAVAIFRNIRKETDSRTEQRVIWTAVLPAWIGAFAASAVLWSDAVGSGQTYFEILTSAYDRWRVPLVVLVAGAWLLSWRSADGGGLWRIVLGGLTAVFSAGVMYLAVCGVYFMYEQWSGDSARHVWYAYAFGPSLVLIAMALGVMVMIGMLGHASPDWRREWWTRLGSWMGIYGAAFLAISLGAILGPVLTLKALDGSWGSTVQWSSIIGWAGTVIGGLVAGNSSQPDAERAKTASAKAVGIFARVAAVVFIIGAICLVATLVHVLLVKIWASGSAISANRYWFNANVLGAREYLWTAGALLLIGVVCSWRFELNVFGLNQFYRNRLVRCYLGATRWVPGFRKPHEFTGFDADDDLYLSKLRHAAADDPPYPPYRGPFPIVNCALNLGGSSDLALHTRHSASFVMTPLRCGADRPALGYAPSSQLPDGEFGGNVKLGQAISVSGAAASPNMGYDTSPLVAFASRGGSRIRAAGCGGPAGCRSASGT
jgi:hypothetical protein